MSKILFVTSFAKDMYKASGKKLIKTFIDHKINSDLLICYENFNWTKPNHPHILDYLKTCPYNETKIYKETRYPNEGTSLSTSGT